MTEIKIELNNIAEAKETINTLYADLDYVCTNIRNVASLFKAMHYGISEGAISEEDVDGCMCAFQTLINSVLLDAESAYGINENFLGR